MEYLENVTSDELLLIVHWIRHGLSKQNAQGFGEADASLVEGRGEQDARSAARLITTLGPDSIDEMLCGDLKRQKETRDYVLDESGYQGPVKTDTRLRAVFDSRLHQQEAKPTVKEFGLDHFVRGEDGLYHMEHEGKVLTFDPIATRVNPFEPLYCKAYMHRKLRAALFPGGTKHHGLTPFWKIEQDVATLQEDVIHAALEGGATSGNLHRVVAVSPC